MDLPPKAQLVQNWLLAHGLNSEVILLPSTAHTADQAAAALHCTVAQIAKSIVFESLISHNLYLVIASGAHRISEALLTEFLHEPLIKASASTVESLTKFPIGGIPPVAHTARLTTIFDPDLLTLPLIWAAAGHPRAVFSVSPQSLLTVSHATVTPVC